MGRCLKNRKKAKRTNKKGAKKGEGSSLPVKVWEPGVDKLEDGEELEYDPSAYNALHAFEIGCTCLSFDILRDSFGLVRTEFPHTVYCVAGTQAEKASRNTIRIFKLSNISGKRRDLVPAKKDAEGSDMESDSSDSDEDDEEEGGSGARTLQLRKVFHNGGVNRIRAMSQYPHICASWADTGYVQVWDFSAHINSLAESTDGVSSGATATFNQAPLVKFKHKDEGFALDWSPLVPGRLLSGDCNNCIHLWEPTSGATWNVHSTPFVGHTASVEDLQWSASDPHEFASCSVDGSVAIWDTRLGKSPAATIKAHKTDVNVISWNRLAGFLLASGSDDGTFSIWDRRLLKDEDSMVAHFEYLKHPITSIEWSPHEASSLAVSSSDNQLTIWDLGLEKDEEEEDEDSMVAHFEYLKHPITSIEWSPHEASSLAVSSSDNQLTIWDLGLEKDEEEEAEYRTKTKQQPDVPSDTPPQLLFSHQGQKDLKELHWHPQIPGMIISTAADGFNILMPSNIEESLPPVQMFEGLSI